MESEDQLSKSAVEGFLHRLIEIIKVNTVNNDSTEQDYKSFLEIKSDIEVQIELSKLGLLAPQDLRFYYYNILKQIKFKRQADVDFDEKRLRAVHLSQMSKLRHNKQDLDFLMNKLDNTDLLYGKQLDDYNPPFFIKIISKQFVLTLIVLMVSVTYIFFDRLVGLSSISSDQISMGKSIILSIYLSLIVLLSFLYFQYVIKYKQYSSKENLTKLYNQGRLLQEEAAELLNSKDHRRYE